MLCIPQLTRALYFLAIPDNRELTLNFVQVEKTESELLMGLSIYLLPHMLWQVCRITCM